MTQIPLDILADLGAATTNWLWLPVLAWTALTLPLWALLERTDRLHPNAEYRLSQLLLAALPIGIVAVSIIEMLPAAAQPSPLPVQSILVIPAAEPVSGMETGSSPSWTWMHGVGLLTLGALGVGLFFLGRLALEIVVLRRIRRSVGPSSSDSLQSVLETLVERLNVHRPVRLCTSSDASVPMTLGGPRPTILVPDRLTEATEELRLTLRHELVHIRRWDDCAQLAERFVAALFAVHPLVVRLRRQIAKARERACDAAVLDGEDTSPASYARLLTTFADGPSPHRLGALSLSESPSSLTDRLSAMRSSMPSLLSSRLALGTALVAAGLVLTLGVVACSDSVAPSPSTDAPTTAESSSSTTANDGEVYMVVEDQPELVGGMKALQESLSYPQMAKQAGIEGRVIVRFVVDKSGNVTNPKVTRGVNEVLNQAALKAVKAQEFKPGRQDGEPVKVQMSVPVTFRLPGESSSPTSDRAVTGAEVSAPIAGLDAFIHQQGSPIIDKATRQRLNNSLSYPTLARKAGMEGKVRVRFSVTEAGEATNPRVVNDQAGLASPHDLLAESVLHTVKNVRFTAMGDAERISDGATQFSGQEVSVQFQFRLPEEES